MNNIDFSFEEMKPEYPEAIVKSPQISIFNIEPGTIKVIIYFMANCALSITNGTVKSAMGKTNLQYVAESPSGAYTACQNIRKICFTIYNAQGISPNFKFNEKRT